MVVTDRFHCINVIVCVEYGLPGLAATHIHLYLTINQGLADQGSVSLRLKMSLRYHNSTNFRHLTKCIFCSVWVKHFVWKFKSALWNFPQNVEPIHHKIGILQNFFCVWFRYLDAISLIEIVPRTTVQLKHGWVCRHTTETYEMWLRINLIKYITNRGPHTDDREGLSTRRLESLLEITAFIKSVLNKR